MIRVGHLNAHNRPRAVRYMLRQGCDSLGLDEARRRLPLLTRLLARARRYRLTVGAAVRAATPVLTRTAYPDLGEIALQACEAATPAKLAPPRWVTVALFRHPGLGRIAHLNVHPHAITDDRPLTVPRVRETAEYWQAVDRLLTLLEFLGYTRILTGDLNSRRSGHTVGYAGADDVLDKHHLNQVRVGLDGVAFDRNLRVVKRHIIPREVTGSDHPGLLVDLALARS